MTEKIERCIECDEPTGNAGREEDSLYSIDPEAGILHGPYCDECWERDL